MRRRATVTAAALLSLMVLMVMGGPAEADSSGKTWRRYRGKIVYQTQPFASFSSEKELMALARSAARNKVLAKDRYGNWTMNFIAFLRSAPGASKVNLVWYKLGKKREQVDFTEFVVPPDGKTLQAKASVRPVQGFKPGDRLEVRVTRLIAGREKVYASCRVTLK